MTTSNVVSPVVQFLIAALTPFHQRYLTTGTAVRLDSPLMPPTFVYNPAWTQEERDAAVKANQLCGDAMSVLRAEVTVLDPTKQYASVEEVIDLIYETYPDLPWLDDITFQDKVNRAGKLATRTYFGTPTGPGPEAQQRQADLIAQLRALRA